MKKMIRLPLNLQLPTFCLLNMSSIERDIPLDKIDLTIDPKVIQRAHDLLGGRQVTPEAAKKWIKSPGKEVLERVFLGMFGSIFSSPLVAAAAGSVLLSDGNPVLYRLKVGFLGERNRPVNVTEILKIRTLRKGSDASDQQNPWETTLMQGTRSRALPQKDPRSHSEIAAWLRVGSLDEFPQLWQVLKGEVAGVSPRAYTLIELRALAGIFQAQDQYGNILPENFPADYREVVSDVQPKPGFASFYTAIHRKNLTPAERCWLDHFYLTCANRYLDFRLLGATVLTALRRTGAR